MKTTISVIIAFLVMICSLFAQNLEPAQKKFSYKGHSVYLDQHPDFRALDTTFNLLWHWYSGKKMSKSLGVNLVHISPIDFWARIMDPDHRVYARSQDLQNVADSVHMIINSSRLSHGTDLYKPTYGIMVNYEPTLLVDSVDPDSFTPRAYDTTRPVYG